jgi:glycosyltransferase involved in cell wall biosynthesis
MIPEENKRVIAFKSGPLADSEKQSIVIVGPVSPPYGGPEKITESLLGSPLFNSLFDIHHVNTQKPLSNEQRSRFQFINVLYNVRDLANLIGAILRHRPRTVFVFLSQNKLAFARDAVFIAVGVVLGRRVVASREGSYFQEFYSGCGTLGRWLIRRTLRLTTHLRVESEMIRSQFDGLTDPARVTVCRTGIDPGPLGNLPPREPTGCLRILFMANISVAKGAVDLVRAIAVMRRHYSGQLQLRLAGGYIHREQNITGVRGANNAETQIAELIEKHGLADCVAFPGPVYGAKKIEEFAAADVFVLPSYSEGLSNALMEAVAAGLPVIAARVGALPECVAHGENGFLIEPGDSESLGKHLAELANDPGLRLRMGKASRALCEKKFRLDDFVTCLAKLL